ncbi:hypothetical protein A2305_02855 [Candidatus Curtissbacteria bacterium RIFOXYB2_FULL_41_10]|uniref:Serine protease n=1 Tax=Candidatus Curtissbacteria bacterium RIFOXYA1_FULL_41_14 TaxID=1797737 RepID=A0A1F5HG74_9BACT|nr:MAG: Peptidase S1 and S6 chymotrypsin/Hap [Candidatus Levybacteria bacterium GW2011_GWA1_39_32]OGE03076.1 MAG: hypothetical protein A2196_04125 [Candidatus Curtissbacteria bacterium RIFOXYA1_FULL_41_14]OGE13416.1 MAG: hypothetical protein A2305_02855 [Candidatus Curtissbacteria bacterium RIFOXYB2_FULL_41_10]
MKLNRYKKLLILFGAWIATVGIFLAILWLVELIVGVTDFSQIKGGLRIVLIGTFLIDIIIGIFAFLFLCAELLHLLVFNREKKSQDIRKHQLSFENPLEKITLARFVSRFSLSVLLAFIFGLVSLPFLKQATDLSFEEKANIGAVNIWKTALVFGLLTGLFSAFAFAKKRFRLTASFLLTFLVLGIFMIGLLEYNDASKKITPSSSITSSNASSVCDRSNCSPAGVNDAKSCTVLVLRDDGGHGSGFSIAKGYLVTNKHVIEDANRLKTFINGEKDLTLWNHSPTFDVAVLKLSVEIPTCKWFDSSQLTLAEQLFAIGWPNQPFGDSTVTAGIYSRTNNFEGGLEFVQTDAPINPGNSGGPLVNKYGIVGMNTLKEVWVGEDIPLEGLGNALSSKFLMPVVDQLIKGGQTTLNYPKSSVSYSSQKNVPAPKVSPTINVNQINKYLSELRVVRESWRNCSRCPRDELERMIDSFNRQIDFCETLSNRLSEGKTPSQDDIALWDQVVKMSYESSALAQKFNQL